jgi:beta-ketoacyl-acyl-carrier-protein synthase II
MQEIMNNRRVVITGMGAVSVLGTGLRKFWDNLIAGKSGIRRITQFDAGFLPCQIAGEVPDFNPEQFLDRKEARRMARSSQMALAAAKMALEDAGLSVPVTEKEQTGVAFGTSIGGLEKFDEGITTLRSQGLAKVNPFTIPLGLPNIPAFLISQQFQCLGPNTTIATACATGTQAVGDGFEFIRQGRAEMIVTGGTEALVRDFALAGFCAMRALPVNYNDNPQSASRPFTKDREGFVFSEGSGALILEELDHALARNARIYAEVVGHASSCDGYSLASPDPEGAGAIRAMRWALADARVRPEDVDYINAHGTSTPLNDAGETNSIKKVFGGHAYKVAISSIKSMIGHALGASGALEAIACALTIYESIIPPTINYSNPDPELDLDYVPNTARRQEVRVTLSNSFGLGGQNACLVMRKFEG